MGATHFEGSPKEMAGKDFFGGSRHLADQVDIKITLMSLSSGLKQKCLSFDRWSKSVIILCNNGLSQKAHHCEHCNDLNFGRLCGQDVHIHISS